MINLDLSYVIANVIIYINLTVEDLNKICLKLKENGYIIDDSYENICLICDEWKDFFKFDKEIIYLISNDILFESIFINTISTEIKQDIFNSMLYRNSKQK